MNEKACDVYKLLIDQGIKETTGGASFRFLDIEVEIEDKNPIGYLFQNWFMRWLDVNHVYHRENDNSQQFPDFYLSRESDRTDLLEMKVFDCEASPNFDVANFEAYCRSLRNHAYRLDADYLIFSYCLDKGKFGIKDVWLKKIWDITGPSEQYPIRTQVKQGMIYNIRPINWYAHTAKYKPFGTKQLFVKALHETLKMYPKTAQDGVYWLDIVTNNYKEFTGLALFDETTDKLF